MYNILGLIISFGYLILLIGLSSYGFSTKKLSFQESRKFVHIGASNWWLIAWLFFDNYLIAAIVPSVFLVVNILNYKYNFIPGLEDRKRSNGYGTILYTISVLLLTIFFFQFNKDFIFIGAIATLILGYGDGLAGVIGEYFGRTRIDVKGKSVEGTLIMLITSFLVSVIIFPVVVSTDNVLFYSLFIAVLATTVELFSPKQTDNLFVPLITAAGGYLLYARAEWFYPLAIAFTVSAIMGYVALLAKRLTPYASLLSILLGTSVYFLAGPYLFYSMIIYYASSALLETYHNVSKKYKQRNIAVVIENGFAVLLFAIFYHFVPAEQVLTAAFVAVAGANSDAWGSAIGYYSKEKVREILTGKVLPKGESGGVTNLGILGSLLGALLIAVFSLFVPGDNVLVRFLIIVLFGFVTSILDSIFGMMFQAKYLNTETGIVVEKKPRSMKNYKKIRGYTPITNGMVNLLTITLSSTLASLFAYIVFK